MPETHTLKCWTPFYDEVVKGTKEFEVRKNDRNFQPGDEVIFKDYTPLSGFSGRQARATIGYLLHLDDVPGLDFTWDIGNWVVFALVDVTTVIP
jgi:hypothetical protein